MTKVRRLDLATAPNVEQDIEDICNDMDEAGDFKLVATFTMGTNLVLIFQK